MDKQVTVLLKELGKEPRFVQVECTHDAMCKLIGGAELEVVHLPRPCSIATMYADADSQHREPNFCIGTTIIHGSVFFCSQDSSGGIKSITPGAGKAAKAVMMLGKLEG